jgi:CRISPR-associated protein Cmr6
MRAAVPRYVGAGFGDCPPGHRFGIYFPVWKDDWTIEKDQKSAALKQVLKLPEESVTQLSELRKRQAILLDAIPEVARLSIEAKSTAPFATGLGLEHPLENGFAFLNPYGLAYLPGSSIKGALRRAAEELAKDLVEANRKGWSQDSVTALFGLETEDRQKKHTRGVLAFWDALPRPAGNSLGMDVLTPHYGDYYRGESTPHDAGKPVPNFFLVVPAESVFSFHLTCDTNRIPEELGAKWQDLMRAAFKHAFDWLGFGAKTAVGYGAMQFDEKAEAEAAKEKARRKADAQRAAMTPAMRAVQDFIDYMASRHESLRGRPNRANGEEHNRARQFAKAAHEAADWTAEEKGAAVDALEEWLPKVVVVDMKDERKKLKLTALRVDG